MADRSIVDYLGAGVAASRPTTPSLGSGVCGIYYATDTDVASLWDGSTWNTLGGGGGVIGSDSAYAGSNTTMTSSNTFYDAVSLSLDAGTWLIMGTALALCASAASYTSKLWDGTTVYVGIENTKGTGQFGVMSLTALVVLGSTTTVKISLAASAAGAVIYATPLNNNTGIGNTATGIVALQIA